MHFLCVFYQWKLLWTRVQEPFQQREFFGSERVWLDKLVAEVLELWVDIDVNLL